MCDTKSLGPATRYFLGQNLLPRAPPRSREGDRLFSGGGSGRAGGPDSTFQIYKPSGRWVAGRASWRDGVTGRGWAATHPESLKTRGGLLRVHPREGTGSLWDSGASPPRGGTFLAPCEEMGSGQEQTNQFSSHPCPLWKVLR